MPPTSHAPAKTAAASAMSPGLIVLLLSLLLGLQPVTTDLYLPALPALTEGFGASMAQAQLTLTALLLSFGLSQLVWGPLSDRFGRRPVLLWGMVAYVAASVGSALAASMDLLIVWRTVQGAAMGAGVMGARAVVRDLYQPVDAARAMSKGLSGLGVIACASAPLGGLLSDLFGWRATLLGRGRVRRRHAGADRVALRRDRAPRQPARAAPGLSREDLGAHPAPSDLSGVYWGQTPISL
jgi:DHA1 family bicyclomycin/chloramphenicol resistance-like MFS transporter